MLKQSWNPRIYLFASQMLDLRKPGCNLGGRCDGGAGLESVQTKQHDPRLLDRNPMYTPLQVAAFIHYRI